MTQDDDGMAEVVRRALREMDPPPAVPREEMWARIQAARGAQAADATVRGAQVADATVRGLTVDAPAAGETKVIELRARRRTYVQWGAALAAMLVIGIGLGRLSLPPTTPPADTQAAAPAPSDEGAGVPTAYRVAASRHLQQTEALFASLAVDTDTRGTDEVTSWARELLTDTRLLLGSPAAEDPAMGRLLEDLELLLSQIAMIPATRAQEEVELIQDGINQSDVLMRLRAATTGRPLVGT